MAANPAAGARFDASMGAVSTYALEAGSAAELFDWSREIQTNHFSQPLKRSMAGCTELIM
jgi:hypothetical protein